MLDIKKASVEELELMMQQALSVYSEAEHTILEINKELDSRTE